MSARPIAARKRRDQGCSLPGAQRPDLLLVEAQDLLVERAEALFEDVRRSPLAPRCLPYRGRAPSMRAIIRVRQCRRRSPKAARPQRRARQC